MIQLNPPLWLETPRVIGLAHFVTWSTPEHSLFWTVFDEATGQIWTWANERVRAPKNITLDRTSPEKPPRAG